MAFTPGDTRISIRAVKRPLNHWGLTHGRELRCARCLWCVHSGSAGPRAPASLPWSPPRWREAAARTSRDSTCRCSAPVTARHRPCRHRAAAMASVARCRPRRLPRKISSARLSASPTAVLGAVLGRTAPSTSRASPMLVRPSQRSPSMCRQPASRPLDPPRPRPRPQPRHSRPHRRQRPAARRSRWRPAIRFIASPISIASRSTT